MNIYRYSILSQKTISQTIQFGRERKLVISEELLIHFLVFNSDIYALLRHSKDQGELVSDENIEQLKEKFKDAANKKAIEDGEQVYLSSNLINDFTALEDKISGTIEPTDIFKVLVKTDAWSIKCKNK